MKKFHNFARYADKQSRGAFSVLELLVVMGILSLIMALLLPAIVRARSSARRLACMNHLRQLALGMTMHVDQQGRYPAAGLFAATGAKKYHNWVASLLPQLDQADLFHQYDRMQAYDDPRNLALTQRPIPVLACPDDISIVNGKGNLSYVVNGGIGWTIPVDCPATVHADEEAVTIFPLDLNGNGVVCPLEKESGPGPSDLQMMEKLSLFFVENWPPGTGTERFHRPADVTDGLSQTLMLSENVRAGYDAEENVTWGSPEPLRNLFLVSSEVCPERRCTEEQIDLSRANDRQHDSASRESLNAALNQAEGTAPWPSSGHPGLVNAAWCDGRVTMLSDDIDGRIYFAIVTPQGNRGMGSFAEPVVTAIQF